MRKFLALGLLTLALVAPQAVLAQGAVVDVVSVGTPIRGANGLILDSRERLYVASVVGRDITILDRNNGAVLGKIGPDQGVETPDDLAFTPDGSLYWTSLLTGEVGKLAPGGAVSHQFVNTSLNSITASANGRVFASQCGFLGGSELYELDPNLVNPPRLITAALGTVCGLNGMDIGNDGFIYGPRFFTGDLARVNPDTGAFTIVATDIEFPSAVKFDSRGRLWVTDFITGRIYRVNVANGDKTVVATLNIGIDNLVIDSKDRVFVSNNVNGEIVEVLANGSTKVVRPGGLTAPGGLAVVPKGNGESVWVADLTDLLELDGATGAVQSLTDSTFRSPLDNPTTVAADGANLIITSWTDSSVQIWDPVGKQALLTIEDLGIPMNALRFQGDLIVNELLSGSVIRVSGSDPSQRTTLASGLFVPTGLAATNDALWVADWGSGVVWQIVAGGQVLATPQPVAGNLAFPEGLTVDRDGSLLVVETGTGKLLRINPANGNTSTVASGLRLGVQAPQTVAVPSVFFSDVKVGPSGTIYVSGDVDSMLYRIRPNVACTPDATNLCLVNGRFRASAHFLTKDGYSSDAFVMPIEGVDPTVPSGLVFFTPPGSGKAYSKVYDTCQFGGTDYLFFSSSLSRDEYFLWVNDTQTGALKQYYKPQGQRVGLFVDPQAFPCNP
ncbi:MAG: hypothetical protein U0002_16470 [Thermoanaerobaculia bacterium]